MIVTKAESSEAVICRNSCINPLDLQFENVEK